jgi:hypothetical protein
VSSEGGPQGEIETGRRRERRTPRRRPLLDASQPDGFVRYPYYAVREVSAIFSMSDDLVRKLFRNAQQGPVLEICMQKAGKRAYRTLLIPYGTVQCFIARFTKEPTGGRSNDRRAALRLAA